MNSGALRVAAGRVLRLAGMPDRYRYLDRAMAVAGMDRAALQRRQLASLRSLLLHAGRTVPYYRDLFSRLGFEPGRVRSVEDLARLPVLDKDIIRQQGRRMVSRDLDPGRLVERRTGGSTGEPLRFFASRTDLEWQMAINVRGFALAGFQPGGRVVNVWGYGSARWAQNAVSWVTGRLELDAFDASAAAMDRWIALMRVHRPAMIYGYAGVLDELASHLERRGVRLPGLELVCSTAEKLFDEQRGRIARATGAAVRDMYGCHEVMRLASECTSGRMHMAPDAAVLEFEPTGSAPLGPRRILVTSLVSRAMPFIRYDVGDMGHALDGRCACGLDFPLMGMDVGKVHHVLQLAGGHRVHSSLVNGVLYPVQEIRAYQIRQISPSMLEILAVAHPGAGAQARQALGRVRKQLRSRLPDGVTVRTRLVDRIPRTRSGKRPLVVMDPGRMNGESS